MNLVTRRTVSRTLLCCVRRALSSRVSGMKDVYRKIQAAGPITVAEYMRECLVNPMTGYYMKSTGLGPDSDFITSPEITQVFGELLGVWVVASWMSCGQPASCQLVELGPGNGTLLQDMLRVFGQFKNILPAMSLHLVEASPSLAQRQKETLKCEAVDQLSDGDAYQSGVVQSLGVPVHWYRHTQLIPRGRAYYIAHEFFDALPVHQFKRTQSGWREVLVDIDPAYKGGMTLRYVLAPGPTPASAAYGMLLPDCDEAEFCPEALMLAKELSSRIRTHGGAALIADYGEEHVSEPTLRAFKSHRQCHPLTDPGMVDITADVNFGAIRHAAEKEGIETFGPVTQNEFLHKLGIRQRIDALLQANPPPSQEVVTNLINSYKFLTSPDKMGQRFKFLILSDSPQTVV